jgi:hypothetical protein
LAMTRTATKYAELDSKAAGWKAGRSSFVNINCN